MDNLCNLTLGGEGTSYSNGFTDEHKKNISNAKIGKTRFVSDEEKLKMSERVKELYASEKLTAYFKNKKLSEKTKQKMSEAHKNIIFSIEHKNNLSKSLSGRKLSEQHKENLRKSKLKKSSTI